MGRIKVVVVDDDEPVRKALWRLFRSAGYDVEALEDAAAFLARDAIEPPACLVLDLRMPGMSGLDLLKAISGTPRCLPVVFITGHGDDQDRSDAMAAGAVDVLDKPLDQTALLGAIERALASVPPRH